MLMFKYRKRTDTHTQICSGAKGTHTSSIKRIITG